MRIIITVMMSLTFAFFIVVLRDKEDIFSPKNITPALYIIKIIPGMISLCNYDESKGAYKYLVSQAVSSDNSFLIYGLLQTFSFIAMMIMMNYTLYKDNKKNTDENEIVYELPKSDYELEYESECVKAWGIVFFLIGFVAIILNVSKMGGIVFFLNNLQSRTILMKDQNILNWLTDVIIYAPILLVYSKKFEKREPKIGVLMWGFVLMVGLMGGMGGRKDLLFIVLNSIITYNYCVKKIDFKNIINGKVILIGILLMFFFSVLPLLRNEGQFQKFMENPYEMFMLISSNLFMLFVNESYVPFYITTVYHFNSYNLWYGKSFMGLLTAFIPSSLYSSKGPVDDGMYLYSISLGRTNMHPVIPVSNLNLSSYPLETFGSMYANFEGAGVIIGMTILGFIIAKSYLNMKKRNNSLLSVLLYSTVVFNFELSTLRIVQFVIAMILISIVTIASERVRL